MIDKHRNLALSFLIIKIFQEIIVVLVGVQKRSRRIRRRELESSLPIDHVPWGRLVPDLVWSFNCRNECLYLRLSLGLSQYLRLVHVRNEDLHRLLVHDRRLTLDYRLQLLGKQGLACARNIPGAIDQ